MGDRIGVLDRGRLVQVGSPAEVYANPKNTFVARSVGSPPMNLIDGAIDGGNAVTEAGFSLPIEPRSGGTDGRDLIFGIRPEDMFLASGAPAQARVHDVENHGVEKIVTLRAGDSLIRLTTPAHQGLEIDETVRFSWNPDKVILFDRRTGRSLAHAG